MPGTMHEQVMDAWAEGLRKTSEGRAVLDTYRDMIEDESGIAYTNAIGQPYNGWPDGQVAAYARVHYLVASGAVRQLAVPVGAKPGQDADRSGNQDKLNAGLPPEFTAEIYQGNSHDGDALLSWPQDAAMPWIDGLGNEEQGPLCEWSGSAPLEIGYTYASRTFLHLFDTGIVARWPYESEDIWLFFFGTFEGWLNFRSLSSLEARANPEGAA